LVAWADDDRRLEIGEQLGQFVAAYIGLAGAGLAPIFHAATMADHEMRRVLQDDRQPGPRPQTPASVIHTARASLRASARRR